MCSRFNKFKMQLRMEAKAIENSAKPPSESPDIVQTADYVFSRIKREEGDSGSLLLATEKCNRKKQYLVKHAYPDCACNEFVYTKLAQAMGYCMADAVLFQISPDEKRSYFQTEYIIGEKYLNVIDPAPTYERIREQAVNWKHYFAFFALYGITCEGDGVEILLADDNKIYRVDTTDAFPLSARELDVAGINQQIGGSNPYLETKKMLLSRDLSQILDVASCNRQLEYCRKKAADCQPYFLEPFARLQDVPNGYIDNFLNTLCYFYPDYIGDYFKRYITAMQKQCAAYWKENR